MESFSSVSESTPASRLLALSVTLKTGPDKRQTTHTTSNSLRRDPKTGDTTAQTPPAHSGTPGLVTSIRADARGFSSIKGHTCTVAFHLKLSVHTHVLYPVHYSSPFLGYSMFLHMHALLTLIILELCASCGADASPAQGRIELHVHLDGSIPPKALLHVAQHRNLSLPVVGIPKSIEDIWTSLRSIQEVWKRCAKAWIQKTSCAPYECFKHIMFVD